MPSTLEDYEVLETIGTGSYGVCKKVRRRKDGKVLVWKELDYGSMSETEKQLLVSEVNLLRELRHKYIVRYYDRIINRASTTLYIIMEYCEGGDLGTVISRLKKDGGCLDEDIIWRIAVQLILALRECHSRVKNGKTVLHRDLKPANVFLDSDQNVKLGDFGLARVLSHDTSFAQTYVGTPYYMSPEQMNCVSYNEKSDVWSLGCLLYELCSLRPPFTAGSIRELATKINMGRFNRIPFRYSDELNQFITFLLQVDGVRRPQIENLLEHPSIVSRVDSLGRLSDHRDRISSASSDYDTPRLDSLKRREAAVIQRETAVAEREQHLSRRETELALREQELEAREKNLLLKLGEEHRYRSEKRFSSVDGARANRQPDYGPLTPLTNLQGRGYRNSPSNTPVTTFNHARPSTDIKQEPRKNLFSRGIYN